MVKTDTDKAGDKLVEMLRASGAEEAVEGLFYVTAEKAAAFRAAIIASLCGDVEPVALMWQHDETGRTGFVEHAHAEELEQWERINRPRRFVAKLYPASTVAALKAERDALRAAGKVLTDYILSSPSGCLPQSIVTAIAALTKGQLAPQPQQEQSNG